MGPASTIHSPGVITLNKKHSKNLRQLSNQPKSPARYDQRSTQSSSTDQPQVFQNALSVPICFMNADGGLPWQPDSYETMDMPRLKKVRMGSSTSERIETTRNIFKSYNTLSTEAAKVNFKQSKQPQSNTTLSPYRSHTSASWSIRRHAHTSYPEAVGTGLRRTT